MLPLFRTIKIWRLRKTHYTDLNQTLISAQIHTSIQIEPILKQRGTDPGSMRANLANLEPLDPTGNPLPTNLEKWASVS